MGVRLAEAKKFLTPAPGTYEPENSENYLAEKIQHSMGIKPEAPKAYLTPSPGAYVPEKSERYLQEKISHSLGIKLPSPKPYVTPAPSAYRPEECKEEKAAIAFGIKHSPYVGSLKGDAFVRARTETVKAAVQTQEDFRPRSGTFTKTERPTIIKTIRTTTQLSQPVA